MQISEHIAALRDEGDLMAKAIAAAEPDAPIPTCPEWTLRELVAHTGTVHRWATANVTEPSDTPADPTVTQPDDAALGDWFREGVTDLVTALEAASPDVQYWSFMAAPSPLAFWARRHQESHPPAGQPCTARRGGLQGTTTRKIP